jgi:hypothetical protein
MADFERTIADVIRDLLRDNLPAGVFKSSFYGDPLAIPDSMLPAFLVNLTRTEISSDNTAQDLVRSYVTVTLVMDKRSEFGKSPDEQAVKRTLEDLAQGVDPSTGRLSPYSVVGILRQNFTLGQNADNQTVTISYASARRGEDVITEEVDVEVIVENQLLVARS